MPGASTGHDFVEQLWATRRVGYLIDQIDLSGQNRELIDELVSSSTKYGILTPYTAFPLPMSACPCTRQCRTLARPVRTSWPCGPSAAGMEWPSAI